MNIDNGDNKSVGRQGNIESSSCKPEMNENRGDDENGEYDGLRHVEEETNAMLDDYSMSGGPFQDDIVATQRNPEVSNPSTSTKRKHPSSGTSVRVPEKKMEAANQLSNDYKLNQHFHMPPPLTLPRDASKSFNVPSFTGDTSGATDSTLTPSSVFLPLEFFRNAETLQN
jgi:hypothetical protein